MLLEASGSVPVATTIGEWAGGIVAMLVGVVLVFVAVQGRRASTKPSSKKLGLGACLIALGLVMTVAKAADVTESNEPRADKSLTAVVSKAQRYALGHAFQLDGTFPGGSIRTFYAGNSAKGTRTVGSAAMRFIRVDGDLFIKGNETHWEQFIGTDAEALTRMLGGSWLLLDPKDKDLAPLMTIGNKDKLILTSIPSKGQWWRDKPRTIRGFDCIAVRGARQSTIYVDKKSFRPVRLVSPSGDVADFRYPKITTPKRPQNVLTSGEVFQ